VAGGEHQQFVAYIPLMPTVMEQASKAQAGNAFAFFMIT
jgi:hypothetical protein